eukprot:CAMPEP_0194045826 /NCGR_PEP_ID=MMETSP0009_2-20130614/18273_1 /TAXON_ID=210454 /ORGANISM="Grammatophora oceanica, Strain CCMP 410" /LENGTH=40 /DNA_ID= /DNA_START= /DNA_END= /DNA_ORIENTATION=
MNLNCGWSSRTDEADPCMMYMIVCARVQKCRDVGRTYMPQ